MSGLARFRHKREGPKPLPLVVPGPLARLRDGDSLDRELLVVPVGPNAVGTRVEHLDLTELDDRSLPDTTTPGTIEFAVVLVPQ